MSLVQLIDGHNPSDRKSGRPGPACYRLFRLTGTAYDGSVVGAIEGYTGSQCINIVLPPCKGAAYGTLSTISTITVRGGVEAGSYPFCSGSVVLTPLSDDELRILGYVN